MTSTSFNKLVFV